MSIITPLDYERYAVLVSPLLVPGAAHVEAKQVPRRVDQLSPVASTSYGFNSGRPSTPEQAVKLYENQEALRGTTLRILA